MRGRIPEGHSRYYRYSAAGSTGAMRSVAAGVLLLPTLMPGALFAGPGQVNPARAMHVPVFACPARCDSNVVRGQRRGTDNDGEGRLLDATADFNGDGEQDVVSVNNSGEQVQIRY